MVQYQFCSSLEGNLQTCYKGTDCDGDVVTESGASASADACCFSEEGLSYEDATGTCIEPHCAGSYMHELLWKYHVLCGFV